MMGNTRRPNAMLIELVIVILFFSISAGIILQLFVAAHDRSLQSSVDAAALLVAEDYAERFMASPLDAEAFMADAGFEAGAMGHEMAVDDNGRTLRITAAAQQEAMDSGALDSLTLTVYDGDRAAVTLPIARYRPQEEVP